MEDHLPAVRRRDLRRVRLPADRAVRAIVSAWEHGFVDCDDVLAFAGLSESAYRAALKRIRRLARRLPPDLREAALDLLRSAS